MVETETAGDRLALDRVTFTRSNRLELAWSKIKRRLGTASIGIDESVGGTMASTETETTDVVPTMVNPPFTRRRGSEPLWKWILLGEQTGKGHEPRKKMRREETVLSRFSMGLGRLSEKPVEEPVVSAEDADEDDEIDDVVVENVMEHRYWDAGHHGTNGVSGSSERYSFERRGSWVSGSVESLRKERGRLATKLMPLWMSLNRFFRPQFDDIRSEQAYQRETWYTQKSNHIFGAIFFIVNWILSVALLPVPWTSWNIVDYGVLEPLFIIPLLPMAIWDIPLRYNTLWQRFVFITVWLGSSGSILDIYTCHYYGYDASCGDRDFLTTLFYATAIPCMGLFALGQNRMSAMIALISWIITAGASIMTSRVSFIRNMIFVAVFLVFIILTHYWREMSDRRMFSLRAELKIQFKALQRAEINERKTMDSKRRFSSYIFHEVRVPLNTALLAFQNLTAANVMSKKSEYAMEYQALEGSLQTMSQVLNDVLDFSRMERGGFSSISRPFSFHRMIGTIVMPLQIVVAQKGLTLITNIDRRIDDIARKAAYPDDERIQQESAAEGSGVVMGDEMRLRQVISNLCSNACKFTAPGGHIFLTTRLVYPSTPEEDEDVLDFSGGNLAKGVSAAPDAVASSDSRDPLGAASSHRTSSMLSDSIKSPTHTLGKTVSGSTNEEATPSRRRRYLSAFHWPHLHGESSHAVTNSTSSSVDVVNPATVVDMSGAPSSGPSMSGGAHKALPTIPETPIPVGGDESGHAGPLRELHAQSSGETPKEHSQGKTIVIRIEVADTGVGIRPSDMADNQLFSAYVQTEIGRKQGGKGTGLGLSLVRQIVMLSGGRLGVKSKLGRGSMFWVELPFKVGPETRTYDEHLESYNEKEFELQKEMDKEMERDTEKQVNATVAPSGSETPRIERDEPIEIIDHHFASDRGTYVGSSDHTTSVQTRDTALTSDIGSTGGSSVSQESDTGFPIPTIVTPGGNAPVEANRGDPAGGTEAGGHDQTLLSPYQGAAVEIPDFVSSSDNIWNTDNSTLTTRVIYSPVVEVAHPFFASAENGLSLAGSPSKDSASVAAIVNRPERGTPPNVLTDGGGVETARNTSENQAFMSRMMLNNDAFDLDLNLSIANMKMRMGGGVGSGLVGGGLVSNPNVERFGRRESMPAEAKSSPNHEVTKRFFVSEETNSPEPGSPTSRTIHRSLKRESRKRPPLSSERSSPAVTHSREGGVAITSLSHDEETLPNEGKDEYKEKASNPSKASALPEPQASLPSPSLQKTSASPPVSKTQSTPKDIPPSKPPAKKSSMKVLVVDDDTLTRRLMSRMITRMGYDVSTAENGAIALDKILYNPLDGRSDEELTLEGRAIRRLKNGYKNYSIVFLDNQMPIYSGLQVVSKLRSLGRDDFVVGVTANALLSDQNEYLTCGANYVLTKPVFEGDLKKYLLMADQKEKERAAEVEKLMKTLP